MAKLQSSKTLPKFGEFLRNTRTHLGKSSRAVAEDAGMLPSNYCKLELGSLKPPHDPRRLKALASALDLNTNHENLIRFFDLAAEATESVPVDLAEVISEDERMPVLLRSFGNRRISESEFEQILALVKHSNDQTKTVSETYDF